MRRFAITLTLTLATVLAGASAGAAATPSRADAPPAVDRVDVTIAKPAGVTPYGSYAVNATPVLSGPGEICQYHWSRYDSTSGTWQDLGYVSAIEAPYQLFYLSNDGVLYAYSVAAVDCSGHEGSSGYSTGFNVLLFNDRSMTLHGAWTHGSSSHDYDGDYVSTAQAGASALRRLAGQNFGVVANQGPTSGWLQIYLDGVRQATVNLYAAHTRYARVVWRSPLMDYGTHLLRLVDGGSSGHGSRVAIDAIADLH